MHFDATGRTSELVDEPNDTQTTPTEDEPRAEDRPEVEPAEEAAPQEGEASETSEVAAEDRAEETGDADAPAEAADVPAADAEQETASDDPEPAEEDGSEGLDEASLAALEERADEEGVPLMELLLEEGDYLPERHQRGDLVEGIVVSKSKSQLVVNIGAKQEGVVQAADLARLPAGHVDGIEVGDTVKAIVVRPENRDGEVVVSLFQALSLKDWERAQELLDSGEIHEREIVGYNKGGILVGFGNLQGFVPRSHFARAPRGGDGGPEQMAEFIGETIPVKVIEVSRRKRRLIMSERQALRVWRADRKKELLSELAEGEVRKGRVSSIADFGAFVDLGGADGLVHVSEMTYERGKHPRDVVRVGQEVEVYVLSVDTERKRIGLSLKRMQKDPWQAVEENHYIGELVEARVSNIADFGAFARLDDGLEGLIHISELSDTHIDHPSEVVRAGQPVTVEVISIEPDRQRIGLSLRRVPEHLRHVAPEAEPEAETEPQVESEPETEAQADAVQEAPPAEETVEDAGTSEPVSESDDAGDGAEAPVEEMAEADAGVSAGDEGGGEADPAEGEGEGEAEPAEDGEEEG